MARSKAAKGMSVEVLGDKELLRKFKSLEGVGTAALLETIVHAVAEPIGQHASNLAPHRTGLLEEEIIVKTLTKRRDECVVGIGPSKDAWYGLFQEIGTSQAPAQPFLRPSFDEGKGLAKDEIGDKLRGEIEKVARK